MAAAPGAPGHPAKFRHDRILIAPKPGHGQHMKKIHARLGSHDRGFKHLAGIRLVHLPPGLSVAQAVRSYQASGAVEFAEPDYMIRLFEEPNDPAYANGKLWALRNDGQNGGTAWADIEAVNAWETDRIAPDIIVAVVDTGIRYTHKDISPNLWINPGESGFDYFGRDKSRNGRDDDGNGYIDDIHGINAITGSGDPMDEQGHGTHVAGTIGAAGNNGLGLAGVAWKVQLMACKFMGDEGEGSTYDAIKCLDYARRHGASIINASWGSYTHSRALERALSEARKAGLIVVCAAGNDATNNDITPSYPAGYAFDNILSVSSTTRFDTLSSFSNTGPLSVHLAAPGSGIYSTFHYSDDSYQTLNGTSMAAPHVAGAAALLRQKFPLWTPASVIDRLLQTADPLPALTGKCRSGGRLNLARALGHTGQLSVALSQSILPQPAPEDFVGHEWQLQFTNHGNARAQWTLQPPAPWISLSHAVLRLGPGQSQTMTARIVSPPPLNTGQSIEPVSINWSELSPASITSGSYQLHLQLRQSITLTTFPSSSSRGFTLQLKGEPLTRYEIQASTDLRTWVPIESLTSDADGILHFEDTSGQSSQRFFRCRLLTSSG